MLQLRAASRRPASDWPKPLKNSRFYPLNRVQNKIKKKLTGDTVFAIVMPHTDNADNKQ
jgi:hypothetical protein